MSSSRISAEDLHTNQYLEYSQSRQTLSEPLILENHSSSYLVFKIKTNQKNTICLYRSHGFLPPNKKVELPVKILEMPAKQMPLKLQINFAQVIEEQFNQGDSKKIASIKKDFFKKIINIYPESDINQSGKFGSKPEQKQKKEQIRHSESFTINQQQPANPFAIHFATLLSGKVDQSPKQEKKQEVKPQNTYKPTTSIIRSCKKIESHLQEFSNFERTPQSRETFVSVLQETDEIKFQTQKKIQKINSSNKYLFNQLQQGSKNNSQDLFKSARCQNFELKFQQTKNGSKTSFLHIQQPDSNPQRKIISQKKNRQIQALQRQLDNLQQKIHLYWEFNNDLQTIKIKQIKKYSIIVFVIVSVVAFALGGLVKCYQY